VLCEKSRELSVCCSELGNVGLSHRGGGIGCGCGRRGLFVRNVGVFCPTFADEGVLVVDGSMGAYPFSRLIFPAFGAPMPGPPIMLVSFRWIVWWLVKPVGFGGDDSVVPWGGQVVSLDQRLPFVLVCL
jgi:hypothetical protein